MGGRRLIIVTAVAAGGVVAWSALRQGRAPYPSQFVGVGIVYTVAMLLGEASPELGAILAVAATIGLAYTAVAGGVAAPTAPTPKSGMKPGAAASSNGQAQSRGHKAA